MSCVTIGAIASRETQKLFEGGEYTKYLYLHGLSVESAEALAELSHKQIREELGIAGDDAPHVRDLFHQKYRGSRYSFGYPACPNLEDQTKLFALLHPDENIGVHLTTGFLLDPGAEHLGHHRASSRREVLCGVAELLNCHVFEDRVLRALDPLLRMGSFWAVFVRHVRADSVSQDRTHKHIRGEVLA